MANVRVISELVDKAYVGDIVLMERKVNDLALMRFTGMFSHIEDDIFVVIDFKDGSVLHVELAEDERCLYLNYQYENYKVLEIIPSGSAEIQIHKVGE